MYVNFSSFFSLLFSFLYVSSHQKWDNWVKWNRHFKYLSLLLFIDFWERGGEKEREREILICFFTYLCIHWLLLLCALIRDWTCNLGILGRHFNEWSYLTRAYYISWSTLKKLFFLLDGVAQWIEYKSKGHRFDSQPGHMPRFQARSPVGGVLEATTHIGVSRPLFLLPFPSV